MTLPASDAAIVHIHTLSSIIYWPLHTCRKTNRCQLHPWLILHIRHFSLCKHLVEIKIWQLKASQAPNIPTTVVALLRMGKKYLRNRNTFIKIISLCNTFLESNFSISTYSFPTLWPFFKQGSEKLCSCIYINLMFNFWYKWLPVMNFVNCVDIFRWNLWKLFSKFNKNKMLLCWQGLLLQHF